VRESRSQKERKMAGTRIRHAGKMEKKSPEEFDPDAQKVNPGKAGRVTYTDREIYSSDLRKEN